MFQKYFLFYFYQEKVNLLLFHQKVNILFVEFLRFLFHILFLKLYLNFFENLFLEFYLCTLKFLFFKYLLFLDFFNQILFQLVNLKFLHSKNYKFFLIFSHKVKFYCLSYQL